MKPGPSDANPAECEPSSLADSFHARVMDGSHDCLKVLDLDGRLLHMNSGGMKVLEICDLNPFIGSSWIDFWHGPDRKAALEAVATARSGGVGRFVGFFPTTQTRKPKWWDVVVSPILGADGRPEKLLAASRDATEWKRAELLLNAIIDGTAAVTGTAFFRSLVQHLARGLNVRWVFIAECIPSIRARSLAFWEDDSHGENFEYDLQGTPCMEVAQGRVCHVPDRLRDVFPRDRGMIDMGGVSYLGVPVLSSARKILGHLVVFDDKPMPFDRMALSVLETFANRAGAELERERGYQELQRINGENSALVEVNRAIGRHLHRDELFGALAGCLQSVVPTERFGIELPIEGEQLQGHILTPQRRGSEPIQPTVVPSRGTVCDWVIRNGDWFVSSSRDELRENFPVTFEIMKSEGMESLCALPLVTGGHSRGTLFFMTSARNAYVHLRRGFLEQVASAVAVALDDCIVHEEVRRLRDRLAAENAYLQEEIRAEHNFEEIVGNSPALIGVLDQLEQIAPSDSTVLILGETGTGKELIARAIHDRSGRKDRPLVKVNCGAISAGLVESELFGHVKGAFTGALSHRDGRFKLADGGTIFLDEVGELPLDTQVKLLRVLQEQEFEPVGSSRTIKVNVRIIAATNRDLATAVKEGKFRGDLYYRLNVLPVRLPALHERAGDIPLLVTFFLQKFARKSAKPVKSVPDDTMRRLVRYSWPGNIRELQNVIERAVVLSSGNTLSLPGDFDVAPPTSTPPRQPAIATSRHAESFVPPTDGNGSLEEIERGHIQSVLTRTQWIIEGPRGAAKILNMNPSTLRSRMQKLGIRRPANQR